MREGACRRVQVRACVGACVRVCASASVGVLALVCISPVKLVIAPLPKKNELIRASD